MRIAAAAAVQTFVVVETVAVGDVADNSAAAAAFEVVAAFEEAAAFAVAAAFEVVACAAGKGSVRSKQERDFVKPGIAAAAAVAEVDIELAG